MALGYRSCEGPLHPNKVRIEYDFTNRDGLRNVKVRCVPHTTKRHTEKLVRDRRRIQPRKWGRQHWDYLFLIARYYDGATPAVQRHLIQYADFIPCPPCRQFYEQWIQAHPVPRNTGLFSWVYRMKSAVNEKLNLQAVRLGKRPPKQNISCELALAKQRRKAPASVVRRYIDSVNRTMPTLARHVPDAHRVEVQMNSTRLGKLLASHFDFAMRLGRSVPSLSAACVVAF